MMSLLNNLFYRRKNKRLLELEQRFGRIKTEGMNMDLVRRYFLSKDHSDALHVLSDQTCDDLDVDLFFCYADRASSKVGQQVLYDRIRTVPNHLDRRKHEEEIIDYFNNHPKERLTIQYELSKLNGSSSYYLCDLFQKKIDKTPKWQVIIPFISLSVITLLIASFFNSKALIPLLLLLPVNVIIHFALKRASNLFINSVPSLLALGSIAQQLIKHPTLLPFFGSIQPSIHVISSIRRNMSFFKLEQKVDSDMEAAYWFLIEFIKIVFLLEPLLLLRSMNQLRTKQREIEQVFSFVGQVDCYLSILSMRTNEVVCSPTIIEGKGTIHGKNIRHPLVPNCVPNSIDQETSSILLTGSNMSGKTTFIRAVGLNYISGIALNTCFAESIELPVYKLFSLIRVSDDITQSSSYFMTEVEQVLSIIKNSDESPSLILLDELFKGTNTLERIAAAKSILSHLAQSGNQVIVSTHDLELTKLLDQQYALFHFSESVNNSSIDFDYKIKPGIPKQGNALRILALKQYPTTIVEEANKLLQSNLT